MYLFSKIIRVRLVFEMIKRTTKKAITEQKYFEALTQISEGVSPASDQFLGRNRDVTDESACSEGRNHIAIHALRRVSPLQTADPAPVRNLKDTREPI